MSAAEAATGSDLEPDVGDPQPHGRAGAAGRLGLVRVAGRLGWGVADQAVSSLSNVALGLYVARAFPAATFGAFSLAYLTYSVVLNVSRGMATDPLLVRFSGAGRPRWRRATGMASGTALLTGAVAGVVCIGAGLLLPDPLGPAFVALGVGLPGLMLQDSWRFAFFAAHRPSAALMNDSLWTLLLLVTLVVLHQQGRAGVFSCLVAYGGTAAIASLAGALHARVAPRPDRTGHWLHEHRQLSSRYLAENVSASGAQQLRSFALGGMAGLAVVGHVRGAEILMGPFVVVLAGVSQVAVPEASRVLRRSATRLARFCLALGGVQATAALAWGLVLVLALPRGLGEAVLADLWIPSAQLIPAVTVNIVAACFLTSALAGLRATGVAWRSLRTQLTTSAAYAGFGIAGAAFGGALGTCWGVAFANTVGSLVAWHHLRAAVADHRSADHAR